MENVMMIAIAAIATAALGASGAAFWAANEARKSTRAILLSTLYEESQSGAIHDSLKLISELPTRYGADFAEQWQQDLQTNSEHAAKINDARKTIRQFYTKALLLHESSVLSSGSLKTIMATSGMELNLDIFQKMDAVPDPDGDAAGIPDLSTLKSLMGFDGNSLTTVRGLIQTHVNRNSIKALWEKFAQYL